MSITDIESAWKAPVDSLNAVIPNRLIFKRLEWVNMKLLFSVVMMLSFASQSLAYMMTGNQRLDHAIYAGHDPKLIVAGQIVQKDVETHLDEFTLGPTKVSFRFQVATVILGEEKLKGQMLTIPATSFMWPNNLVTFEEGTDCVLILHPGWEPKQDEYSLWSVVAVSTTNLRSAKDGEEAKAILAEQILAVLKDEPSETRHRHLIQQVAPILPKAASDALVPFLKSDDVWLRRMALAGLVYATNQPQYLKMAHEDIAEFIERTESDSTIVELDGRSGWAPYPILFSHYFFLSVGWGAEEDQAAEAYLPLFRFIAQSERVPEWTRWKHGIRPLCRIGTRDDLEFLYKTYSRALQNKGSGTIFDASDNRRQILYGLSRILGCGPSNSVRHHFFDTVQFVDEEEEQHKAVRYALADLGVLEEDQSKILLKQWAQHLSDAGVKYNALTVDDDGLCELDLDDTDIESLMPLKGMPLKSLSMIGTAVADLSPLKGMPLNNLDVARTGVEDLRPLQGMPLRALSVGYSNVEDLSPLAGMPLLNLSIAGTLATDISVLRGMKLRKLDLSDTEVADLSDIQELPLTELVINNCPVSDLTPLKGMRLTWLYAASTAIKDISALEGMPLEYLFLTDTKVLDLTPLHGMPLIELHIGGTPITDLTPLKDVQLSNISISILNIEKGIDVLCQMKSLDQVRIDETWTFLDPEEFRTKYGVK